MFKLVFTKNAAKYYGKIDDKGKRLLNQCFDHLRENPLAGASAKRLHGELEGLYRYRVGGLRVIYKVEVEKIVVLVVAIGSRGDIYK